MSVRTFFITVYHDECDDNADCVNLKNSYCADTNGDNLADSCLCKRGYTYNNYTDRCEQPGGYLAVCKIEKDCRKPFNCKENLCQCSKGHRFSYRRNKCMKGIFLGVFFVLVHWWWV